MLVLLAAIGIVGLLVGRRYGVPHVLHDREDRADGEATVRIGEELSHSRAMLALGLVAGPARRASFVRDFLCHQ
jgi:hypothetical protein